MKKYAWMCLAVVMLLIVQGAWAQDAPETAPAGDAGAAAQPADVPTAPDGTAAPAEGADGEQEGQGEGEQPKSPGLFNTPLFPIILIFVVMYFFMFRGQRKKQKEHRQMLESIQRNARVRTIGGIIGTVVDVRDDEVVIKIDESNNTKMHVARSAVGKVLTDEE